MINLDSDDTGRQAPNVVPSPGYYKTDNNDTNAPTNQLSAFEKPTERSMGTSTADLPAWTPEASKESALTSVKTEGTRIRKSGAVLWKQPSKESWINDAISTKRAEAEYLINHPVEQKLVINRTKQDPKTFPQDPNKIAAPAQPMKVSTNQCVVNMPAIQPVSAKSESAPNSDAARSELAKLVQTDIATKLNEGSTASPSRPAEPYAIDWSQTSGSENKPSTQLGALSKILQPVQPRAHVPEDPWQLQQEQYGVQPVPLAKRPSPPAVKSMKPFEPVNARRIPAAQTLSLPAQETSTNSDSNSDLKPESSPMPIKPTLGAFNKATQDSMTTTLQLELEEPLFEEPLHKSAKPQDTQYTKRGLPHSMVTTQQLRTMPPGNRRAEEYKKALKSNLALQRKCQTLVDRLVQERTAKLELLNHELQVARDQAVESANVKAHFVANISHELRTPLSGILGMTEILKDMNLNEEQSEIAGYIYESAEALLSVITDLLDFSKLDSGNLELSRAPLSVRGLVETAVKKAAPVAADKHIDIHSHVAPEVPDIVVGDSERIEQVLGHFINNAVKFTEEGSINIDASIDEENEEWVVVRFSVSDTGMGIPETKLPDLFSPFVQGDDSHSRRHGGTGLGLALAKGMVTSMSGGIGVTSAEGQGSTFTFTIPFHVSSSQLHLVPIKRAQAAS